MKTLITIFCLSVCLSGCANVSFYNLVPPYNSKPEKVDEVINRLNLFLLKEGFEKTYKINPGFYAITGMKVNEADIILKFYQQTLHKNWPFRDEYYIKYVYVVPRKKGLIIVTFPGNSITYMGGWNEKLSNEFKDYIINNEIQLTTRSFTFLN